jgi:archaellum biogenesis ATPase FlaH
MKEAKILAAMMQNRDWWKQLKDFLKEEDYSPEGAIVYDLIAEFYEADDRAYSVDPDILRSRCDRRVSSSKHVDTINGYIDQLYASDVSGINIVQEALEKKAHTIGMKLAAELASGKQGPKINQLIDEYTAVKSSEEIAGTQGTSEEEEYTAVAPTALLAGHFDRSNLIEVWPKPLNELIDGGAKPGHHILVFAPTEMGKTLMVINMVAGFLKHGHKVLYIGNEDPAPDILMRAMTRLTGMTKYEIMADPAGADKLLRARNWDLFTLAGLAPGTFAQIHQLVEKYNPKVVVLDQLRNIYVNSENRTQALEKAATEARNMAKRYGVLVVSVTQAADSASKKTILDRGDVDSSNIGIPGQCDLMIGIGADAQMEEQGLRVLSFTKNKLSGRHTPIPVTFNYALSRIEAGV